jgi:long-chain acyl-CoA synthetase
MKRKMSMRRAIWRDLLLDYIYEHEERRPTQTFLTQPLRDGQVVDYDWGQVLDQARRMASHLGSLDLSEAHGSRSCPKTMPISSWPNWRSGWLVSTTVAIFPNENPRP